MERSRAWLLKLFDAGRAASRQFLERHGADIGVRETLDIARVYSDGHKPKVRVPAIDEAMAIDAPVQASSEVRSAA